MAVGRPLKSSYNSRLRLLYHKDNMRSILQGAARRRQAAFAIQCSRDPLGIFDSVSGWGYYSTKTAAQPQKKSSGGCDALRSRGLLLAKSLPLYSLGRSPKSSLPSGQAPFLLAERGERPPKGRIPFGNPYGQTNSGLRLRRPKGQGLLAQPLFGCP